MPTDPAHIPGTPEYAAEAASWSEVLEPATIRADLLLRLVNRAAVAPHLEPDDVRLIAAIVRVAPEAWPNAWAVREAARADLDQRLATIIETFQPNEGEDQQ